MERLVRYVWRVAGDEGVAELRRRSGMDARWSELTRPGGWCGLDDVLAVAEAAAAVCHEPEIGRRAGEQHFHDQRSEGVGSLLHEAKSMREALTLAVEIGERVTTTRSARLVHVGDRSADIEMHTSAVEADAGHRFFCSGAAGYLTQLPLLFGQTGAVVESTCQHLGADRCRFHLVWDDSPTGGRTGRGDTSAIERFEQLQAMAAEITRPEDVDVILERVVTGVRDNLGSDRSALVVHLPGERHRRQYLHGFPPAEHDRVADAVLDGTLDRRPDAISVPIASTAHAYGHLVAVPAPDTISPDQARRMLAAYASHAAAALDGAVTLAQARRSQATAEGLLALAGALARVDDMDEIAHHLVHATTAVTGADQAVVLFWEPGEGAVVARAWLPKDAVYAGLSLARADIPELTGSDSLLPRAVDIPGANPLMAEIMRAAGTTHAITVPISLHDEYLGTLVAGYADVEPPVFDQELTARARGLADQTAAAVQNVKLVEQIRHQALHDALTGLPNRPLMEDRAEQAIVQAQRTGSAVALLFLDLDRFKTINDTLGHPTGDEVLKAVADRLTEVVRSSDTVSRQGGDEFLVLLTNQPDARSAEHTAHKILRSLERPFEIAGHALTISASIGVVWSEGGGATYEDLLRRADAAMYRAKETGRNAVAVHEGDERPATADESR